MTLNDFERQKRNTLPDIARSKWR